MVSTAEPNSSRSLERHSSCFLELAEHSRDMAMYLGRTTLQVASRLSGSFKGRAEAPEGVSPQRKQGYCGLWGRSGGGGDLNAEDGDEGEGVGTGFDDGRVGVKGDGVGPDAGVVKAIETGATSGLGMGSAHVMGWGVAETGAWT